ncbi:hypothetical protein N7925_11865 [Streptomyces sp. CA-278952]|uniref:hypothetical protein n=1 Tax=unclassified Streptomyces TaxID=2593676 RepID=UPI0023679F68|nr:hypothetical protein [Streptomyces sp. CA-278952]WDG28997.1 hypothetical protein N7925_11865 [Streptomyces sp. CA-278952]
MGVEAHATNERVTGRTWTVRLDPVGRGRADVRVSCSRPACAAQVLPSAAVGRTAAVEHLKAHLRADPAPRPSAYCACRATECHTHIRPAGPRERPAPWRCGGAVVLAVVTDREGRWWQVMECCSRCAAAHPTAKIAATAPAPDRTAPAGASRAAAVPAPAVSAVGPHFSHTASGAFGASGAVAPHEVPAPRSERPPRPPRPARQRARRGRIAQRFVPHDLRPITLRDELTELGELFRAYQQRAEPDLAMLADLHARKAKAFSAWAEVTADTGLRLDAQRAEQAAATARLQHLHRIGEAPEGEEPAVARLLTAPAQWDHARAVLAHVADDAPLPGSEARLLVVMLTLRTAQSGTGNLVGQDLKGLPLTEPEDLVEQLLECGWLKIAGTVEELIASRPENPTRIDVPSLTPDESDPGPFTFGRKMRPKLSGWAQRVVGEKKLRKAKTTADARLLALALATGVTADGRLGPEGEGLGVEALSSWCAIAPGDLRELVDRLTAADWLTEAVATDTVLTGRLTERVLPLTCPLV